MGVGNTVGTAYIEIRGDTSNLETDLVGVGAQLGALASSMSGILVAAVAGGALEKFASTMLGIADSVSKVVDSLSDFSDIAGISINTARQLQYAFEASGDSWEAGQMRIMRLSRTMGEATTGSTEAAKAFSDLGVSLKDNSGKALQVDQVLLEVADKLSKMSSASEKAAAAAAIFGRGYAAILPTLNKGKQGILELANEAVRMGITLTAENAKTVDEYIRTKKQFDAMIGSIQMELGITLMPVLKDLASNLRDAFLGPDGKLKQEILNTIGAAVTTFRQFAEAVIAATPGIIKALDNVLSVVTSITSSLEYLFDNPIMGTVMSGFGAAGQGLQDIWDLAMNWKLPTRQDDTEILKSIKHTTQAAAKMGDGFLSAFSGSFGVMGDMASGIKKVEGTTRAAGGAAREMGEAFRWATATGTVGTAVLSLELVKMLKMIQDEDATADFQRRYEALKKSIISNGMDWNLLEAAPGRGDMPDLTTMFPESLANGIQFTLFDANSWQNAQDQYYNFVDVMVPGMGMGFQAMQDSMAQLAEMSEADLARVLITTETFASSYLSAAMTIGDAAGLIMSAGMQGGWKQMIQQAVTMIAQYFGKQLIIMGTGMIAKGAAYVVMGSTSMPPNVPLIAAGNALMTKGGITSGIGAMLLAMGPAIGGMVGGAIGGGGSGGGSSASSSFSSGGANTNTVEPYSYTLGQQQQGQQSQPVNVTINAMDSGSFHEYMLRNGGRAVAELVNTDYRANGSMRSMRR